MKLRLNKSEIRFFAYQLAVFVLFIVIFNLTMYITGQTVRTLEWAGRNVVSLLIILWIVFAANNYILVPLLNNRARHRTVSKTVFWTVNTAIILFLNRGIFHMLPISASQSWNDNMRIGYLAFVGVWTVVNYVMIGLAIGRHAWLRQQRLKAKLAEERQRNTEAELAWLKNQLNPHFLFNTLNNISSLVQIDPDSAQDKIAQLSDLLRYALYDTREEYVELTADAEFMKNYIELMSLRCGPNVDIKAEFDIENKTLKIAPMLFLSSVENAFKHGVSASRQSFIHISLKTTAGGVEFGCENSNYPKDTNNHSGSGIGIENMRKRLELMYQGRYEFEQKLENDVYSVRIKIEGL